MFLLVSLWHVCPVMDGTTSALHDVCQYHKQHPTPAAPRILVSQLYVRLVFYNHRDTEDVHPAFRIRN